MKINIQRIRIHKDVFWFLGFGILEGENVDYSDEEVYDVIDFTVIIP